MLRLIGLIINISGELVGSLAADDEVSCVRSISACRGSLTKPPSSAADALRRFVGGSMRADYQRALSVDAQRREDNGLGHAHQLKEIMLLLPGCRHG